ncbi:hypothetical protein JF50_03070 [Pseudoalteromonas luteoviolacea]|uniref:Uncharacterized protein n=1 Tax=Pseudoalteromonas luteoviolacea TaxID=43657 RepID=A0A0C1MV83_9GAMM|nr:hypothetical protein [Pseudoalteromonas luteoviolacea]KID58848.1 hypothetical protein JF50_03070 [Pseudoalteromonas luteoviolacea]
MNSLLGIALTGTYSGATSGHLAVNFLLYSQSVSVPLIWQNNIDVLPYEQQIWHPNMLTLPELRGGVLEVIAILKFGWRTCEAIKKTKPIGLMTNEF